jgi:hypothetical protein
MDESSSPVADLKRPYVDQYNLGGAVINWQESST